jgi:hypothetical protein
VERSETRRRAKAAASSRWRGPSLASTDRSRCLVARTWDASNVSRPPPRARRPGAVRPPRRHASLRPPVRARPKPMGWKACAAHQGQGRPILSAPGFRGKATARPGGRAHRAPPYPPRRTLVKPMMPAAHGPWMMPRRAAELGGTARRVSRTCCPAAGAGALAPGCPDSCARTLHLDRAGAGSGGQLGCIAGKKSKRGAGASCRG